MPLSYDLQQEIDNATNGLLILPTGQIVINQPVIIPNNFTLIGTNTEILINFADKYGFYIQGTAGYHALAAQDISSGSANPTLEVDNASGFAVGDEIAITTENAFPKKAEFNVITAINGNVLSLQRNFLLDYKQSEGINVTAYTPKSNVTLKNIDIKGTVGLKTLGVFAKYTNYLTIDNVRCSDIAVTPIHIEYSFFPSVINSSFKFNGRPALGDHSVGVVMSMSAQVKNNTLVNSGGLYVKGSTNVVFSNNSLNDVGVTGGGGISIVSTFKSAFLNNTILQAECYGIWLLNGSQGNVIQGNIISSSLSSGIYLGEKLLTTFANESIKPSGIRREDIVAQNLPINFNVIAQNICSSSRVGNGIFIDAIGNYNTLSGNETTSNSGYGVLIHGSNNIITNNISSKNSRKNINVVSGKDNISHDNIDSPVQTVSSRLFFWRSPRREEQDRFAPTPQIAKKAS